MAKSDLIPMDGTVTDVHAGGFFSVTLDRGEILTIKLSGSLRQNKIRIVQGDRVEVGLSPYDARNGLITRRK